MSASGFHPDTVAFITGAASGIGLATAQRLVLDGVRSLALVDISSEQLVEAEKSLSSLTTDESLKLCSITTDVTIETEVDTAVQKAVDTFGRLDICLNSAGISGRYLLTAEGSTEMLNKVLDINVKGTWYCERAQLRQFMKQDLRDLSTGLPSQTRGTILNVGSLASLLGGKGLAPYTLSKHAVLGLTRSDAPMYGPHGIRINCLCPSWIATPMTIPIKTYAPERYEALLKGIPMGRFGHPEEVAFMAAFLLSDKASFITGGSFEVTGGCTSG